MKIRNVIKLVPLSMIGYAASSIKSKLSLWYPDSFTIYAQVKHNGGIPTLFLDGHPTHYSGIRVSALSPTHWGHVNWSEEHPLNKDSNTAQRTAKTCTQIYALLFIICSIFIYCSCCAQSIVNEGYGDYLLVLKGEFQMGDNYNEGAAHEKPVHTVYLDNYYIGKYKVTNGEYKKFMDDCGYATEIYWSAGGYNTCGTRPLYWDNPTYRGGGIPGNEKFPVIGVNWYEANAYCLWLSMKTGKEYRLPREAEWEKAARGTTQRKYPWGNSLDGSYANYDNSGDPFDNITPVDYYDGDAHDNFQTHCNASPFGVFDMAGNIWEWCSDWYNSDYYSGSPSFNPTGPASGKNKVIRGGSWKSVPATLRSSNRGGNDPPVLKTFTLGFRCVREY